MPLSKYEGLNYPTHFLKSRGSVIRIIFLNTELNKPLFLLNEIIFIHCSLQIKQKICAKDFFRVSVVTHFIAKV